MNDGLTSSICRPSSGILGELGVLGENAAAAVAAAGENEAAAAAATAATGGEVGEGDIADDGSSS